MPTRIDQGASALAAFLRQGDPSAGADRNEATTRLQLIDRVLFEFLDWNPDEAVLEHAHNGQYADYLLTKIKRVMVVEAKKEGSTFALPLPGSGIDFQLSTLLKSNGE